MFISDLTVARLLISAGKALITKSEQLFIGTTAKDVQGCIVLASLSSSSSSSPPPHRCFVLLLLFLLLPLLMLSTSEMSTVFSPILVVFLCSSCCYCKFFFHASTSVVVYVSCSTCFWFVCFFSSVFLLSLFDSSISFFFRDTGPSPSPFPPVFRLSFLFLLLLSSNRCRPPRQGLWSCETWATAGGLGRGRRLARWRALTTSHTSCPP